MKTVFILLAIASLASVSVAKQVFRSPPKCGKDWSHVSPRSRATVTDKKECMTMCSKMDTCQSFQVRSPTRGKCQLLRNTTGAWARKMTPKQGWSYRERYEAGSKSCSKFPYRTCSPEIRSFSNRDMEVHQNTWGMYQRDSILNDGRRYWISGYGNERWLYEYSDDYAFRNDIRTQYYMPFGCHGLQAIVRNRHLWCKEYNNRKIVIYNIDENTIVARISFDSIIDEKGVNYYAGHSDHCRYDWGGQSDIDVMNDFGGAVTIVWGRYNYNCYLAASEIDPDTYEIMDTHWVGFDKRWFGNAFSICGRIYFTDHYQHDPATSFEFIWDLRTGNYTKMFNVQLAPNYRRFDARHNYNAMSDFNPMDETIYKWHNSRFVSVKVNFEPPPADLFQGYFPSYYYYRDHKAQPHAATLP